MASKKLITENEARKIWLLHEKGLKASNIALAIDRSPMSVSRVVEIFTMVQNAEWDALASKHGDRESKVIGYAKAYFAAEQEEAAPVPAPQPPVRDNTVKYLADVLEELRRNNELLEKLVIAWEGK